MQFYAANWLNDTPTPTPFDFATNTPAAATAAPTTTPAAVQSGYELFLPAVAFPSLQTNLAGDTLESVRNGTLDAKLVLSDSTAARFAQLGVAVAPDTRHVEDGA